MKTLSFLLCCALLWPFASEAKSRKPAENEGQTPYVLQMDEDFPIEQLEGKGLELYPLDKKHQEETLPAPLQEEFIRESGLEEYVKGWDGFEKDRLFLRAEHQSASEVAKRYDGKIPETAIRRLQGLIHELRESQQ
jgi:hypothetical protein